MARRKKVVNYRGWIGNILCDSGWEMVYVDFCLDNDIEIVRNTKNFPYPYYKKTRYYRPDFLVDDGKTQTYVEIKGRMDGRSKRKLEHFPLPIRVIGAKEIKPYLEWAKLKYGDNFYNKILEKHKKEE